MGALAELYEAIVQGRPVGAELARQALAEGAAPLDVLRQAIGPAMMSIAAGLEGGEWSRLELYLAARVAAQAHGVIAPLLAPTESAGKVVLGTVEGDLDSVGQEMVQFMFESAGYAVVDLGVDVSPHQFLSAALEQRADIVALAASLPTTLRPLAQTIAALREGGYRGHVRVLAAGAAVTERFAALAGADAAAATPAAAARVAQSWACGGH